jgi:hypothetical protein
MNDPNLYHWDHSSAAGLFRAMQQEVLGRLAELSASMPCSKFKT